MHISRQRAKSRLKERAIEPLIWQPCTETTSKMLPLRPSFSRHRFRNPVRIVISEMNLRERK